MASQGSKRGIVGIAGIAAVVMCVGLLAGANGPAEPAAARTAIPLIGEDAPAFTAETTQGPINFPEDYKGKWVILFSHPADFTPVCTTEFMTFATMMPQFKALNCELIGLSIDSNYSHIAWLRTIKEKIKFKDMENVEVTFPLIEDIKMDVAKKYGMLQPTASDTKAVRAVFFIDPNGQDAGPDLLPAVERAKLRGDHAAADRHADLRRPQVRHAGRLAARRRCDHPAAEFLRRGPGAGRRRRGGLPVPRLVPVPQEAAQGPVDFAMIRMRRSGRACSTRQNSTSRSGGSGKRVFGLADGFIAFTKPSASCACRCHPDTYTLLRITPMDLLIALFSSLFSRLPVTILTHKNQPCPVMVKERPVT